MSEVMDPGYEVKIEIAEKSSEDELYDKFSGVLFGSAIADALGWATEFLKSKQQLKRLHGVDKITDFLTWKKRTGGRFLTYIDVIQPGEYSDDTQLMLCTARSLRPDGTCDMEHFSKLELPYWIDYARGAGATVTTAARAIKRKRATWSNNFFRVKRGDGYLDYRQAGANGAAMRIAPIVLASNDEFAKAYNEVWKNAIVTHGHPRAIIGALIYAKALHLALHKGIAGSSGMWGELQEFARCLYVPLQEASIGEWVRDWNHGQTTEFEDYFRSTKNEVIKQIDFLEQSHNMPSTEVIAKLGCFDHATRGSGVATTLAAIALFLRYGTDYERCVVETVNLIGADTDTIGLMAGGLSGAIGGYIRIPERWAIQLQDFSYFLRVAKALTKIHLGRSRGRDLLPDISALPDEIPDIIDEIRGKKLRRGEIVKHRLFGLGWVHEVMAGWIKKRGSATMTLAHVIFDMGQSCWFKAYLPE
jgi:ADP-ribosylglycohydrolase